MEVVVNPQREYWKALLQRPYADNTKVLDAVREVLKEVKEKTDLWLLDVLSSTHSCP